MFHFIRVVRETVGKGSKKRLKIKLKPNHLKMDYNLVSGDSKFFSFCNIFFAQDYEDYGQDYEDYGDYNPRNPRNPARNPHNPDS